MFCRTPVGEHLGEIPFRFDGSPILPPAGEALPPCHCALSIRYPKYLKANGVSPSKAALIFCSQPVISLSGKDAEAPARPPLALIEEELT